MEPPRQCSDPLWQSLIKVAAASKAAPPFGAAQSLTVKTTHNRTTTALHDRPRPWPAARPQPPDATTALARTRPAENLVRTGQVRAGSRSGLRKVAACETFRQWPVPCHGDWSCCCAARFADAGRSFLTFRLAMAPRRRRCRWSAISVGLSVDAVATRFELSPPVPIPEFDPPEGRYLAGETACWGLQARLCRLLFRSNGMVPGPAGGER
jgi:hypothetical protein